MLGTLATWVQYAGMALAMAGGAPWPQPRWSVFLAGMAVIGVGIAMRKVADRRGPAGGSAHEGEAPRDGTVAAAAAALPKMLEGVRTLRSEAESAPLARVAERIEALQQSGTEVVASAQDAFVRAHSFAAYSGVMAPLATGERLLYRAWSAASDGHRPEAIASIDAALPHLEEAQEALEKLPRT